MLKEPAGLNIKNNFQALNDSLININACCLLYKNIIKRIRNKPASAAR